MDVLGERLSVRLGRDSEVVMAFKVADEAVLGIWRKAALLRDEPESDGSDSARNQIRTLNDETRDAIEAQRTEFDAAAKHSSPRRTRRPGLTADGLSP